MYRLMPPGQGRSARPSVSQAPQSRGSVASVRTLWPLAALFLAGCAAPVVTAAYDAKDPVDRWQAVLRANTARYACGAPLRGDGETRLGNLIVEAQRQATAALAARDGTVATDPEVLGDIAERRTKQERAVRDMVAARGCSDPQIVDLIALAERFSAGQG